MAILPSHVIMEGNARGKAMRIISICLFALYFFGLFFSARAKAEIPLFGGKLDTNFLLDATSISLKDGSDSIYLGRLDGSWHIGIGAETSLFYPISPWVKAGPHFIFDYNTANSSWHAFEIWQTSLGGIIDLRIDKNSSVSAFLDYNFGWFTAEQKIGSVSGYPAPAGDFAGGMPGFILGIKTKTKFSEQITAGVYYNLGSIAMTAIKYRNSSGIRWMNAEINYNQAGIVVYF